MTEKNKSGKLITDSNEWTFELLDKFEKEISRIAKGYKLDTFPNQIEIITAEQMMDAYASSGMPIGYHHWSFGKRFLNIEKNYKRGHMGLAYEIVINSNPCISYCMEENTLALQALIIAHAAFGHNSFFKSNYLFKTWTSPDSIVDYLLFAKKYIAECEEKYGYSEVEETLDACHALMNYGVDRYKRPPPLSLQEEKSRQANREEYLQSIVNDLWRTLPTKDNPETKEHINACFPEEPQENLLYFFEKNAPLLEPWQREILRIVRKMAQYFYPQRQTKIMNEGWATFWHYTICNDLHKQGLINDHFMLEILHNHTNVIYQPPFHSKYYSGLNPYTLGFAVFRDIRRMCEEPTEEDKKWFPDLAGSDWLEAVHFAMRDFKDESFISQFLSPKVIRDLKLFCVLDDDKKEDLEISAIHDENGYQHVRELLATSFNLSDNEPNIQIYDVDIKGDRSLRLRYQEFMRRPLGEGTTEILKHIYQLWGFPVKLETQHADGTITQTYQMPQEMTLK